MNFGGQWYIHLPLIKFVYNNSYHTSIETTPYDALYGRKCRSSLYWEVGERQLTGPEQVQLTSEKVPIIQQRLRTTFSRQKSHADPKRKDVLFYAGDLVFLKVSPMKGVISIGKKGKLAPRNIGPFEIRSKVGEVAYKLVLPPELSRIHPLFHVSMFRKYILRILCMYFSLKC